MPDILEPKDIPNYEKMCKLSEELIRIQKKEVIYEEDNKTTKYQFINKNND